MTAGEYLVSLSGLPSGTALEHLLAIQARIGTGTGETIFTTRMFACTTEDRVDIIIPTLRPPRVHGERPRRQVGQAPSPVKSRVDAYAVAKTDVFFVASGVCEIVAIQRTTQCAVKTTSTPAVINSKPKAI